MADFLKLPPGIRQEDLRVECLRRTVEREPAAIRSSLVGVGWAVMIEYSNAEWGWLLAFLVIRLASLAHNHLVTVRIQRLGPREAMRLGLDWRLDAGLFVAGAAWGLSAWMLAPPLAWTLVDFLLALLLVVVNTLMLITTSHSLRSLWAFTLGLWLMVLPRMWVWPLEQSWQLLLSIGMLMTVYWMYSEQLYRQTLDGVVADLHTLRLSAELAMTNDQLNDALDTAISLATRDPLTQVLNRRAFLGPADSEARAMLRHSEPACLLMVDLDHFKAINDTFGHAMGDFVLVKSSAAIQVELREMDLLARWGGEEFVVLLPRTRLEGGQQVAERIRAGLAGLPENHRDWPAGLRLTVSIGVAAWLPGQTLDRALHWADEALYQAKTGGRNRVVLAWTATDAPPAS